MPGNGRFVHVAKGTFISAMTVRSANVPRAAAHMFLVLLVVLLVGLGVLFASCAWHDEFQRYCSHTDAGAAGVNAACAFLVGLGVATLWLLRHRK